MLENGGGEVYNAPIVSSGASLAQLQKYCDGIDEGARAEASKYVHDKVMAICPDDSGIGGTVTLELIPGFSFARPVLYLRCAPKYLRPAAAGGLAQSCLHEIATPLIDLRAAGDPRVRLTIEQTCVLTAPLSLTR